MEHQRLLGDVMVRSDHPRVDKGTTVECQSQFVTVG